MNEKIDELRRALQREADALGRRAIKGSRYLLLRGREKLSAAQIPKLDEALRLNAPLASAYSLKEELRALWTLPSISARTQVLDAWIQRASLAGIPILARLANTLRAFRSAILNAFVYPISNGKIDGINNKIGAMQRSHFGLRDFHFLSLRILCLHRSKHTSKHTFCG